MTRTTCETWLKLHVENCWGLHNQHVVCVTASRDPLLPGARDEQGVHCKDAPEGCAIPAAQGLHTWAKALLISGTELVLLVSLEAIAILYDIMLAIFIYIGYIYFWLFPFVSCFQLILLFDCFLFLIDCFIVSTNCFYSSKVTDFTFSTCFYSLGFHLPSLRLSGPKLGTPLITCWAPAKSHVCSHHHLWYDLSRSRNHTHDRS